MVEGDDELLTGPKFKGVTFNFTLLFCLCAEREGGGEVDGDDVAGDELLRVIIASSSSAGDCIMIGSCGWKSSMTMEGVGGGGVGLSSSSAVVGFLFRRRPNFIPSISSLRELGFLIPPGAESFSFSLLLSFCCCCSFCFVFILSLSKKLRSNKIIKKYHFFFHSTFLCFIPFLFVGRRSVTHHIVELLQRGEKFLGLTNLWVLTIKSSYRQLNFFFTQFFQLNL